MLWEHEIYNSMDYKAPISYFHTFEAEDCMAAFNFASETEAITLRYDNMNKNFIIRLIIKICLRNLYLYFLFF